MITIVGLGVLGTRVLKRLSEYENVAVIDYDIVEEKNIRLQYPLAAVGMRKIDAAREFIRKDIDATHKHIDWSTAGLLRQSEIVIDCTDNMLVRYVINDYCAKNGIPWIHAAVSDCAGSVAAIVPGGACYQCIYPRGKGEVCTVDMDTAIADRVADIVVSELARIRSEETPRFIRVSANGAQALAVQQKKGCPTCEGTYRYLHPHDYYITFCQTANCMSAKPVRKEHHDRGYGTDLIVQDVPITLFANGEIHFHKHANDDDLHAIAEQVYLQYVRGKQ
jgi:molybdopterin/thiamine biosynthesis adenylyltransferase